MTQDTEDVVARWRLKASQLEAGGQFFADEIASEFLIGARALQSLSRALSELVETVTQAFPALEHQDVIRTARAALHQEGTDVGRDPATHEPSPVSRSRP